MIRKQVYLEPKQDEMIKQLSAGEGKSEAEIIRDAIDRYLVTEKKLGNDPLEKLIGMVEKKELQDDSLNHDHSLYSDQKEGVDEEE